MIVVSKKIKEFQDSSYLECAEGKFGQRCVYMVNPAKNYRRPPLDIDYFGFLQEQAKVFGARKIYDDFVAFYDMTRKEVEPSVLEYVEHLAVVGYGDKWLAHDYSTQARLSRFFYKC